MTTPRTALVTGATSGLGFETAAQLADLGATTVFVQSREAFGQPLANLPPDDLRTFAFGNRLFKTNWIIAPASGTTLSLP